MTAALQDRLVQLRPRAAGAAAVGCLVLPWLVTRAGGPSPTVEPWLVSALCVAAFALLGPWGSVRGRVAALLALLPAWALLRSGVGLDTLALAGGCLLVWLAACAAAGRSAQAGGVAPIAWAWLLAGLASSVIGLAQYFGVADALSPWATQAAVGEAFGNLRQRNQLASLLVIALAALLWITPSSPRPAAWSAAALLAVANAATTSRTGLVALLVLALFTLGGPGGWRSPAARLALWSLACYAVAALALPQLLQATAGVAGVSLWQRVADASSCSSRWTLWGNVLTLIAHAPWLGWGWGEMDYAHYATLYPGERFCDILDNAHNLPLHLAAELGLPAALLLGLPVVAGVLRAAPWREGDPSRRLAWAVLATLGLHSLLEYPLWYGPFQFALGLALGLLWPGVPRAWSAAWVRPAAPAFVAIAVAYAAWDYHRVTQVYLPPEARSVPPGQDVMAHANASRLFMQQARFAQLTLATPSRANAAWMFETAQRMLHYSPEPKVIERVIESATMLGRDDEAVLHLARYRAAFPRDYQLWRGTRLGAPSRSPAPAR